MLLWIKEISVVLNEWQDIFGEDNVIIEYAHFSYQRCTAWFGSPLDADWPCRVVQGPYSGCQRQRLLKSYYIILHSALTDTPARLATLGHEIYHRVTWKRPGLSRSGWVDEMLACHTSQRLLQARGYSNFAARIEKRHRQSPIKLSIPLYQTARRKRRLLGFRASAYPDGFGSTAICLGAALDSLVGWKAMCRLVECASWSEWLQTLPEPRRSPALFLLDALPSVQPALDVECSLEKDMRNLDAKTRAAFGISLFYLGNYTDASLQCRWAAEQDPTYSTPYSHLGQIYADQGQDEEAIQAYREAVKREPDSVTDHSNMGLLLEKIGHKEEALSELQTAASLKPSSPKIRYHLACVLLGIGRKDDAIREWQWVAEQEDPMASAARTRLAELS